MKQNYVNAQQINLILMVSNVLTVSSHISGMMPLKDVKFVEMDMFMTLIKMFVLDVLQKNQ